MTRPLIGITGAHRRGWLMWQLNRFAIWRAGGKPLRVTPQTPQRKIATCRGLVIGGGDDISAELYKGEATLAVKTDPERDALEKAVLAEAEERKLPVLGICRGAQMINVLRGGNLHQDIYAIYAGLKKQKTILPRKTVTLVPGTRLQQLLRGEQRRRVNALHHQAIDRLGERLRVAAHDEHGMVQAIEATTRRFLIGVQWHPEFLIFDNYQNGLFRALVRAARRFAEREKEIRA
jgi:putative glutamine amidotransferase